MLAQICVPAAPELRVAQRCSVHARALPVSAQTAAQSASPAAAPAAGTPDCENAAHDLGWPPSALSAARVLIAEGEVSYSELRAALVAELGRELRRRVTAPAPNADAGCGRRKGGLKPRLRKQTKPILSGKHTYIRQPWPTVNPKQPAGGPHCEAALPAL